jgi:hypothetical protein
VDEHSSRRESLSTNPPADPVDGFEHLLRVAGSVNQDAQQVWAQLWNEIRPHVTAAGAASPDLEKGFVPACGWPEFLERMWLLKHYLDSVRRICQETRTP